MSSNNNSRSNSNSNNNSSAGTWLGILGGAAVAAGGIYLASKLFSGSDNDQEQRVQHRPPFPQQSGTKCIICKEETDRVDRVILKCNHIVHMDCLMKLRYNGGTRCPISSCRVLFVDYDNNRANVRNPNHQPSGPGRPAGYHGAGTKADLDNHSNQRNPNNDRYQRGGRMNDDHFREQRVQHRPPFSQQSGTECIFCKEETDDEEVLKCNHIAHDKCLTEFLHFGGTRCPISSCQKLLVEYDNNRSKQCNPNHKPTGLGRSRGYHGDGTKDDLDNHSNQLNPNNDLYQRKN